MQAFIAPLPATASTATASTGALSARRPFSGRAVRPHTVLHLSAASRGRTAATAPRRTPVCQGAEDKSFNYNIYQDFGDRSKRQTSAADRAVSILKPMGITLEEGQDGMVFVAEVDPEGNAAETGEVKEGDIIVAVSATFGEEVWSTRGVGLDRVLKSIRIRAGDFVTLVLESPSQASQRKDFATRQAEARRTDARDKFGKPEVLDPVSWTPIKQPNSSDMYEYGDPEQTPIDDRLKEKLKQEIAAPYEQNWILWAGAAILVLVLLSVAFGIS